MIAEPPEILNNDKPKCDWYLGKMDGMDGHCGDPATTRSLITGKCYCDTHAMKFHRGRLQTEPC